FEESPADANRADSAIHCGFHRAQLWNHSAADKTGRKEFVWISTMIDYFAFRIFDSFNIGEECEFVALESNSNCCCGLIPVNIQKRFVPCGKRRNHRQLACFEKRS